MIGIRAKRHQIVLFAPFFWFGLATLGCGAQTVTPSQRSAERSYQKTEESSSQDSAESASQKPAERSSQKGLLALKTALEMAQEDLRVSEVTEKRIASELEQLKNSGKATPEMIEAYEVYLDRVQDMVLENRKTLGKMRALYTKYAPSDGSTGSSSSIDVENVPNPKGPDEKEFDELGALDRELDVSLASFDEMLLRELELIREQSADKMRDLSAEAAAAAQGLTKEGEPSEPSSPGTSSETGKDAAESDERKMSPEGGRGEAQTETSGTLQGGSRGEGESRAPNQGRSSRPSAHDDDIVARQIREAAEKETDPVLKEKLWEEYENYKKGSRQ